MTATAATGEAGTTTRTGPRADPGTSADLTSSYIGGRSFPETTPVPASGGILSPGRSGPGGAGPGRPRTVFTSSRAGRTVGPVPCPVRVQAQKAVSPGNVCSRPCRPPPASCASQVSWPGPALIGPAVRTGPAPTDRQVNPGRRTARDGVERPPSRLRSRRRCAPAWNLRTPHPAPGGRGRSPVRYLPPQTRRTGSPTPSCSSGSCSSSAFAGSAPGTSSSTRSGGGSTPRSGRARPRPGRVRGRDRRQPRDPPVPPRPARLLRQGRGGDAGSARSATSPRPGPDPGAPRPPPRPAEREPRPAPRSLSATRRGSRGGSSPTGSAWPGRRSRGRCSGSIEEGLVERRRCGRSQRYRLTPECAGAFATIAIAEAAQNRNLQTWDRASA